MPILLLPQMLEYRRECSGGLYTYDLPPPPPPALLTVADSNRDDSNRVATTAETTADGYRNARFDAVVGQGGGRQFVRRGSSQ